MSMTTEAMMQCQRAQRLLPSTLPLAEDLQGAEAGARAEEGVERAGRAEEEDPEGVT